jgi:hypothetical protein
VQSESRDQTQRALVILHIHRRFSDNKTVEWEETTDGKLDTEKTLIGDVYLKIGNVFPPHKMSISKSADPNDIQSTLWNHDYKTLKEVFPNQSHIHLYIRMVHKIKSTQDPGYAADKKEEQRRKQKHNENFKPTFGVLDVAHPTNSLSHSTSISSSSSSSSSITHQHQLSMACPRE